MSESSSSSTSISAMATCMSSSVMELSDEEADLISFVTTTWSSSENSRSLAALLVVTDFLSTHVRLE